MESHSLKVTLNENYFNSKMNEKLLLVGRGGDGVGGSMFYLIVYFSVVRL